MARSAGGVAGALVALTFAALGPAQAVPAGPLAAGSHVATAVRATAAQTTALKTTALQTGAAPTPQENGSAWHNRPADQWPVLLEPSVGRWPGGKAFDAGPLVSLALGGGTRVWLGAKLPLESAYGGDFAGDLQFWLTTPARRTATEAPSEEAAQEPPEAQPAEIAPAGLNWRLGGDGDDPGRALNPAPFAGFDPWYVGLAIGAAEVEPRVPSLVVREQPLTVDTPLTLATLDRTGAQLTAEARFVAPIEGDMGTAGGFTVEVPELSARLAPQLVPGSILVDEHGAWAGTLIERFGDGRMEFQGTPLSLPWPAHVVLAPTRDLGLDAAAHPRIRVASEGGAVCLSHPVLGGLRCRGPEGQLWSQTGWRSAVPDPSGGFVAAGHGDGRLSLLDARDGRPIGDLARLPGAVQHLGWIDPSRMIAGSLIRGWVARVDFDSADPVWTRAVAPGALAVGPRVLVGTPEGELIFLTLDKGAGKPIAEAHPAPVTAVAWSGGETPLAASADETGGVALWRASGELVRRWQLGRFPARGLAFAPGPGGRTCLWVVGGELEEVNGDLFVYGSGVRVLDLESGREWARSPELEFPVTGLAWSPARGPQAPGRLLLVTGRSVWSAGLTP